MVTKSCNSKVQEDSLGSSREDSMDMAFAANQNDDGTRDSTNVPGSRQISLATDSVLRNSASRPSYREISGSFEPPSFN